MSSFSPDVNVIITSLEMTRALDEIGLANLPVTLPFHVLSLFILFHLCLVETCRSLNPE